MGKLLIILLYSFCASVIDSFEYISNDFLESCPEKGCIKGFLNHTVQIVRFQFKKLISAISSLSNSSLVKISYFTSSFIMLKLSGIFIFLKLYFPIKLI